MCLRHISILNSQLSSYWAVGFYGFQYIKVVLIAFSADFAVFDGGLDGTAGLMAMGTVGKVAVVQASAHFGEEVRQFLDLEIDHAELFYARSVN